MKEQILILFIINILVISVITVFRWKISNYLGLIDHPSKRKLHSEKVPAIGGLIILILFIINFISLKFLEFNELLNFRSLIFLIIVFSLGYLDDTITINATKRLFLLSIIFLFCFYDNDNFIISSLKLSFSNNLYNLNFFQKYFITILCVLLLINAINLSDGINSLASSIITFWSIYIIFYISKNFYIENLLYIFPILIICFLNYKNFFFLGNSGSMFLGAYISIIIINKYNENIFDTSTFVDEIIILFLLPGLDMLRVFCSRLAKKKHPFEADRNHLHHLLIKKMNNLSTVIFYNSIIIIMIFLYKIGINFFLVLCIYLTIYLFLIFYLKRKTLKN